MEVLNLFRKVKNFFINQNDSFWLLILLTLAFVASSITIFGGDLNGRNISTPFFYSTFIIIFTWFGFKLFFTIKGGDYSKLVAVFVLGIAFTIGLFNILIQTPISAYSFNYFKKIIITFTVLFLIYLSSFGVFHPILKKIFPLIAMLLSIEIAISYFSGIGQIYANQTAKNLLYFTFGNSNAAGIYFALLIMICFYGMFAFNRIYLKVIFLLPIVFLVFLLYKTHARNAVYGIALSLFVLFLFRLKKTRNRKIYDFVVLSVSCLLPILVINVYTILATRTQVLDFINYLLNSPGKTTTSRIATWVSAFKHLRGVHFIIGDYYNSTTTAYNLFQTIPGYQNSQIDFFIDEGFVPALLIISFLIFCLLNRMKNIKKSRIKAFLPVSLWLFTIFSSMFEAGLFIGMSVWYVFGFSLLALGDLSHEGAVDKKYDLSYYEITV